MDEFCNLDSLIEKPKLITLAGRQINVAKVPALVVFKTDELRDKLRDLNTAESYEVLEQAIDIILLIARASGDSIDRDWLLENASVEQIMEFVAVATLGPNYRDDSKKKPSQPSPGELI